MTNFLAFMLYIMAHILRKTATLAAIVVLVTAVIISTKTYARESHLRLTTEEGLSNSSINDIMSDSKGRLWLSTWDGVNVYNGASVKVYKNNPTDKNSLLDNIARKVVQQDDRYFWIVTDWGINRLDTYTDSIRRYRLGADKSNPFAGSSVSMTISPKGDIICASRGYGIAIYEPESNSMRKVGLPMNGPADITALCCAGEGRLLILNSNGELLSAGYTSDADSMMVSECKPMLPKQRVYNMFEDTKYCFVIERDHIYRYDKSLAQISDSVEFHGNISYATTSPSGDFYILSDRAYCYRIDFSNGTAQIIPELCHKNLISFCFGIEDITWLAIDGVGLEAVYEAQSPMHLIDNMNVFGQKGGAASSIVSSKGKIYVSVLSNGLYSMLPDGSDISLENKVMPDNGYIFSIEKAPSGNLFLGVRNAVCIYNPESIELKTIERFDANPPILSYCMYFDAAHNCLWVGTLDNGVFRLLLSEDGSRVLHRKTYRHSDRDPLSLSSDNIMHIAPYGNEALLIATLGGGLNIFDIKTGCSRHFSSADSGFPSDNARYSLQDADGSIWVGTSYGICHGYRNAAGEWHFDAYGENEGLGDNTIHSILKDGDGRLWLGTNKGLSIFDPSIAKFINMGNVSSLQGMEFYIHSALKSEDGAMYFGGVNGVNWFYPDSLKPRDFAPELLLGKLTVRLNDSRPLHDGSRIVLSHNENFFNISFSAVEYINNSSCEYSYQLEGFNTDPVKVASGVPAVFTNVPPGKYRFTVSSTNGDGVWCDNTKSIYIRIRNPWYLTWWAYCLYLASATSVFFFVRQYFRERHRQRNLLRQEALEKQIQKDSYEAKLNFFTNIAHEFGTPLTLISCSGERLASGSQRDTTRNSRYIKIINDNACRMQNLIQELLEFRKVESGNYKPHFSKIRPSDILASILDDFSQLKDEHGLSVEVYSDNDTEEIVTDGNALEKIMMNLISNAFKYTPDGGDIRIWLSVSDESLGFKIENTGKGLSQEKLKNIFDKFVILDNAEKQMAKGKNIRNGLGTALVHSLVKTLGGHIEVGSELNRSVTFRVSLPSEPESRIDTEYVPKPVSLLTSLQEDISNTSPSKEDNSDKEEKDKNKPWKSLPRVLVVDDESEIRSLVSDVLSDKYDITIAGNGREALARLAKNTADLVITDINMPGMDGLQLIKKLKENEITRNIPIVVLAFKSDVKSEIDAYSYGSEAFISKPFLPEQLTAVVDGIMARHSSLKKYYKSAASDTEIIDGKALSLEDRAFVTEVVSAIEKRMSDNISPADLADMLNTSEMTLYRRLKKVSGRSTSDFLRIVKLHRAAMLLHTSQRTVQEIMYDCGFGNKSWFYKKFAEVYGLSPKEYRESRGKNGPRDQQEK